MPAVTEQDLAPFIALAALGQAVLDAVKDSGLAKPKRRKVASAKPRRKRRTKAEMAAARLAATPAQREPVEQPRRRAVNDED